MSILALDIGGANLKSADGAGFVRSHYFPLWQKPSELESALRELLAESPPAERIVATMTGELADCFQTKAEGVARIIEALTAAASGEVLIYLTDGRFVAPQAARDEPLAAAASNWHALARFAARFVGAEPALLVDIGSTTCDLIPIVEGRPAASGHTDPERLVNGELVYTGVRRSPVCAIAAALPWRAGQCPTAQEVFSTSGDAYLMLGELAEEPDNTHTADGRPATRAAARDRLARQICADRDMFSDKDAQAAAQAIRRAQLAKIAVAAQGVMRNMPRPPEAVIVSGEGEFLARELVARLRIPARVVSLAEQIGAGPSLAAPAHALAVLAREVAAERAEP